MYTFVAVMWNRVLMTLRDGSKNEVFTKEGKRWGHGNNYYQNLPTKILKQLPMYGTTDITTSDENVLVLQRPSVLYMFRAANWKEVPLDGWELVSTGAYIGPHPKINMYRKAFVKGSHIIDNKSAMYLISQIPRGMRMIINITSTTQ